MRRLLRKACLLLLPAVALAGCNEDNGDLVGDNVALYQQYEVYVNNGAAPAAFANLREGTAGGERVHVSRGALTCNTRDMYYTASESASEPEFNYAVQLEPNHRYAQFELQRGSRKLVNRIAIDDIPSLECPSLGRIENGIAYPLDCTSVPPEFRISVSLTPSQTNLNADVVYAELDRGRGEFSFFAVKTGYYTLRVDVIREVETTRNDGTAAGSMTAIRRSSVADVQVPVETVGPVDGPEE